MFFKMSAKNISVYMCGDKFFAMYGVKKTPSSYLTSECGRWIENIPGGSCWVFPIFKWEKVQEYISYLKRLDEWVEENSPVNQNYRYTRLRQNSK